jgi:hypothetical protein
MVERSGSDAEVLADIMLVQGTMHRQFLRALLRRLAADVPAFRAELFLAELELLQESLSEARDRSAIHAFALKEWEKLSGMALDAIASSRIKRENH